jgi:hypothetical protein
MIRISSAPFELANTAGSTRSAAPAALLQRPATTHIAPSELGSAEFELQGQDARHFFQ